MLGGEGYYRGSSVLISGTAGTGKTSLAALFADAACRRGERSLYFAFEESQSQILRNMRSIGLDLEPWITGGLLRFHSARPTSTGLEMHLVATHKQVREFQPQVVIVDPVSSLIQAGGRLEAASMALRLMDFLKAQQITGVFTNLTAGGHVEESTDVSISSIIDTWLLLRDIELGGERNRGLYILKSRGMAHSNQIREFLLTDRGVDLVDVYLGPEGVLTGSMRQAREAQEQAGAQARQEEIERQGRAIRRKRRAVEAQIAALQLDLQEEEEEAEAALTEAQFRESALLHDRVAMGRSRGGDGEASSPNPEVTARGGSR
jgi:circadian clock protein KaiC